MNLWFEKGIHDKGPNNCTLQEAKILLEDCSDIWRKLDICEIIMHGMSGIEMMTALHDGCYPCPCLIKSVWCNNSRRAAPATTSL